MSDSLTSALAFLLDAPLQSWGTASKFNHRETESHPSKSGILGLIAAAIGIDSRDSDDTGGMDLLTSLRVHCVRLIKSQDQLVHRLSDYHTVENTIKASGVMNKDAVITRRTYLTDSSFLCILEGDASQLVDIRSALENPKWGIWFGRKCNLPAMPISPMMAKDTNSAQTALLEKLNHWRSSQKQSPCTMHTRWTEPKQDKQDGDYFLMDLPVSFSHRTYKSRSIRRTEPTP